MSVPFSADQIDESMTTVFSTYLTGNAGKNWVSAINNMSFIPDYCIVRQISYSQAVNAATAVDPLTYVIYCNISGGYDFMGFFNTCSSASVGAAGSIGCNVCPGTILKVHQRPTQNVNFQILTQSHTAGQTVDSLQAAANCVGDLYILVEFVKLKKLSK